MSQSIMMQQTGEQSRGTITVSVELIAYAALFLLALSVRIAEIDTLPIATREAPQALSVWRTLHPTEGLTAPLSSQPLLFSLQSITMTIFGGSEFAVRLPTVLAGALLCLTPALFRNRLGITRSFIIAILLTLSPTLFASARFSSSMIFAALFFIVAIWSLWKFWDYQRIVDGVLGGTLLILTMMVTEAGGFILGAIAIIAAILATFWTAYSAPSDQDITTKDALELVFAKIKAFPWVQTVGVGVLILLVISTIFMLHPGGMGNIGNLLNQTIAGFLPGSTQDTNPIPTILVYEFFLVLFALIGVFLAFRRAEISIVERFSISWLVVAIITAIIYQGASPFYAVWFIIPLSILASYAITDLFVAPVAANVRMELEDEYTRESIRQSEIVKWATAIISFTVLIFITMYFFDAARHARGLPTSANLFEQIGLILNAQNALFIRSMLMCLFGIVSLILVGFVVGSFWTIALALRGIGLGIFFCMVLASISLAWNSAVSNASTGTEIWNPQATSVDLYRLKDTLNDLAGRDVEGDISLLNISILADESSPLTTDSPLAWVLRDFTNAQYVNSPSMLELDRIVITANNGPANELGGDYVGQSIALQKSWDMNQLRPEDRLSWFTQRNITTPDIIEHSATLWLRQDVYDGASS